VTQHRTTDTAGAGSPAPAVPSSPPDAGPLSADVVAAQARTELDRIRRRWAELPLAQATARMPLLRRLLDDLAARSAPPPASVPDHGPAVVADQLAVLVWDAYAAGHGDGIPELLEQARRDLA
jgi:hypothetical protein